MRPGVNMSSMFRKGPWTPEEDMLLKNYIQKYGQGKWHLVALKAGLNRCRKSCRLRWLNYLSPSIKRGDFQEDEVDLMLRLHKLLGNRWSLIAGRIPGRTANDVKNYWNTHFRSRSNRHKQELKDGKPSQHATVSAIRPQTHTLSKTSNMHPHIEPLNTDNLITSSKDSFSKAFNDSSGLVSSPVVTDDMINDYMDELFEDPEKEIGDKVGSSLQGFSLEGEDLDGVEQDDWKNRWSDILMDDAIWDLLHSEMRNTNQWYQIVGIQQSNQHTHDHHILDCEASDNLRRLEEKSGAYECHLL